MIRFKLIGAHGAGREYYENAINRACDLCCERIRGSSLTKSSAAAFLRYVAFLRQYRYDPSYIARTAQGERRLWYIVHGTSNRFITPQFEAAREQIKILQKQILEYELQLLIHYRTQNPQTWPGRNSDSTLYNWCCEMGARKQNGRVVEGTLSALEKIGFPFGNYGLQARLPQATDAPDPLHRDANVLGLDRRQALELMAAIDPCPSSTRGRRQSGLAGPADMPNNTMFDLIRRRVARQLLEYELLIHMPLCVHQSPEGRLRLKPPR